MVNAYISQTSLRPIHFNSPHKPVLVVPSAGNVLKELVEPEGAVIFTKKFQLGDPTINTLELWGAEYQENDAILCRTEDVPLVKKIASRERCPVNFVGVVTGDGKVVMSHVDP